MISSQDLHARSILLGTLSHDIQNNACLRLNQLNAGSIIRTIYEFGVPMSHLYRPYQASPSRISGPPVHGKMHAARKKNRLLMVTAGSITYKFSVSTDNQHRCRDMLVLGSLHELGDFQDGRYVRMNRVEGEKFEYLMNVPALVSHFEYQYLLIDTEGQYTLGERRKFHCSPQKMAFMESNLYNSGRLLIELHASFCDPAATTVNVYAENKCPSKNPLPAAVSLPSVMLEMEQFKSMVSSLQRENESLKLDVLRLTSIVDGSTASYIDKSAAESSDQIKSLLNEINDLRGKVRVVGRFRPLMDYEPEGLEYAVHVHSDGSSSVLIHEDRYGTPREYPMDDVLGEDVDNGEVFDRCGLHELMECAVVLQNNVCVFCYGQTGSGKSYTMMGSAKEPGLIGLCLEAVLETSKTVQRSMSVQVLEIYMDQLFSIIPRGSVVESKEEILDLYQSSLSARATAGTSMNETSSRSHFVFILSLMDDNGHENQIFFVDLAGSERTKVTNAQGDRLMEANFINKSLSALGLVLNGLLNKSNPFIPYRDSKLTKLLAPVFTRTSPSSKVLMIANLSPNAEDQRETISTLSFAQRVGKVEMRSVEKDTKELIEQKEKQLAILRNR